EKPGHGACRACPCPLLRPDIYGALSLSLRVPVPLQNLVDGVIHLLCSELWEHGQRNAAGRIALRIRDRTGDACLMTPRIAFLLVNGNRIVALGVDPCVVQELE